MENNKLTGIERELVLQYLIDGNVPVTVTPIIENISHDEDPDSIKSVNTAVFPVAIKTEKISISKEGVITLNNIQDSVKEFADKKVKVEFYFNRVGLYFISEMKNHNGSLVLDIPQEISRIEEYSETQKFDFSAVLYYSVNNNEDMNFNCYPAEGFKLFEKPNWSSINLENQQEAKNYLENFINHAKETKKAGNGIQLINICKYIVEKDVEKVVPIKGLVKPFSILFVDHERIVLGYNSNDSLSLAKGKEYALKMSFVLKEKISITRDIFVTFSVDALYSDNNNERIAADCSYTTIQYEDTRFLYEKATSKLFV